MKLLLDSCAFIDVFLGAYNLTDGAKDSFQSDENEIYFSVATVWEIGLKVSTGRLIFDLIGALDFYNSNEVQILGIDLPMALMVNKLPNHHKDPFDRIIIASAMVNGMSIMTSDKIFNAYDVELIKSR